MYENPKQIIFTASFGVLLVPAPKGAFFFMENEIQEKKEKPEDRYRKRIDQLFEKHFIVYREVSSRCNTGRLDYVLQCRESGAWFGVEVKKNHQLDDVKLRGNDWGKFVKQANRYLGLNFQKEHPEIPQKLLIFIAPPISKYFREVDMKAEVKIKGIPYYPLKHDQYHDHTNMNGFIGELSNVGEIRSFLDHRKNHTFRFILKNKTIWGSRYGLHKVNYDFYTGKL